MLSSIWNDGESLFFFLFPFANHPYLGNWRRSRDILLIRNIVAKIVLTECLDLLENDDNNGDDAIIPRVAANASTSSNLNIRRPPA